MTSYHDVCERWVDRCLGSGARAIDTQRVWTDGDHIYSYGRHFEMARIMRDVNGEPTFFLVNGETFSPSTTNHQSNVRSAIQRSGIESIIIPHGALEAATIDFSSIEIIDVQSDHTEVKRFEQSTPPHGARWESYQQSVWEDGKYVRSDDDPWHYYLTTGRRQIDVQANEDGTLTYSWETTRHWLGGSLIKARVRWRGYTLCKPCGGSGTDGELQGPPEPGGEWTYERRTIGDERVWHPRPGRRNRFTHDWDARQSTLCAKCNGEGGRHFTRSRQAYFLSGFDSQEARPSYFFCELPKGVTPTSVDEAFECLKPTAVKIAEMMDREVTRQGDIFAIPLENLDKRTLRKRGARFEKRGKLLNTNHAATEVAYMPDGTTLVRGVLHHVPEWRDPDHARRKLATPGWHVVQKNTVPVAA